MLRLKPGLGATLRLHRVRVQCSRSILSGARSSQISSLFTKAEIPAIYKPRRDPWLSPTMVLLGIMPFFTFAMGTWQLKRLKWKVDLIDELEEKLQLAPIRLPNLVNISVLPDFVFRKVALKGRWDHARSMLLEPRVRDGVHGYHVVTPLIRQDGSTILVDRGFISKEFGLDEGYERPDGEVEILGMLRTSQPRNMFTPENRPAEKIWYWVDADAMAQFAGGEGANVQPVFVEQIFEGHEGEANTRLNKGIPIGRAPTVDLRNSHLSYIVTWYALSGLTAFMFARVLLNKKRTAGRRLPRYN